MRRLLTVAAATTALTALSAAPIHISRMAICTGGGRAGPDGGGTFAPDGYGCITALLSGYGSGAR